MGEKRMYTCMCTWVPMLYSRKKKLYWGNNNNKKKDYPFLNTTSSYFTVTSEAPRHFLFNLQILFLLSPPFPRLHFPVHPLSNTPAKALSLMAIEPSPTSS